VLRSSPTTDLRGWTSRRACRRGRLAAPGGGGRCNRSSGKQDAWPGTHATWGALGVQQGGHRRLYGSQCSVGGEARRGGGNGGWRSVLRTASAVAKDRAHGEAKAFYRRGERVGALILHPEGKGARGWGPRHGSVAAEGAGRGRRSVRDARHAEGRAVGSLAP
jgi:hypothetical protein